MKSLISKKIISYFSTLLLLVFFFTVFSCDDSETFEETIAENMDNNQIDDEDSDGNQNDDDSSDGSDMDVENSDDNQMGDDQSEDEMDDEDDMGGEDADDDQMDDDQTGSDNGCTDPEDFVFLESNGLVLVEFENTVITEDWELATREPNFTGEGYLVWNGSQSLGRPGNGIMTFRINITTTGTYRFMWHSAVLTGDNGTEHNDTWLRFNDADDFFGQKGNDSFVYPVGSGKTPNPEGASADGWFKIYRSGNDLGFKWQSSTSDNDAHNIFVTFNEPGTYLMEVSARSSGHAIDKFVLFNESFSVNEATDESNTFSTISCD